MVSTSHAQGDDPDLYIRRDADPTLTQHDYVNTAAYTDTNVIRVPVLSAAATVFHVGVYGYHSATPGASITFSIQADGNNCPGQCTSPNNGVCTAATHTCACASTFTLLDCSAPLTPIATSSQMFTGVPLKAGTWAYYSLDLTPNYHDFHVDMTVHGGIGDPDLYVSVDATPTLTVHDYADLSVDPLHQIRITDSNLLQQGTNITVGVYGFGYTDTTFDIRFQLLFCPNDCSNAGTCNNATGVCSCLTGYAMEDCSQNTLVLPTDGSVKQDKVEPRTWDYWAINGTQTFNSEVVVTLTALTTTPVTPPSFYASAGTNVPTKTAFDLLATPTTGSNTQQLRICRSSAHKQWYAGIYNNDLSSDLLYSVGVSTDANCPNNCTAPNQGVCKSGTCSCVNGYRSQDCSVPAAVEPSFDGFHTLTLVVWFFVLLVAGASAGVFAASKFGGAAVGPAAAYVSVSDSQL
eukprot:gnl/Hemi2/12775_TR4371_c0_g1_i1.p1 gnl/Hemi2/12775_TR4371_c0_g1~~gnl/Hemi2/12775_TR4371_c0_g1_i1.p1  ORF type:complete len:538 (+),score=163.84 gnl/Hemi2/12775_TR4371_c0_g1_i1:230-1615(+)